MTAPNDSTPRGRPVRMVNADHLAGVSELARLFKVGRTTVSNWYERRDRNGFPEIIARLISGPIWDTHEVVAWYRTYTPVKGAKVGQVPELDDEGRYVPRTSNPAPEVETSQD